MSNRWAIFSVVLVSSLLLFIGTAAAQHSDITIWSTEDGGGRLAVNLDARKVPVFRNLCAAGRCLYSSTDPGFATPTQPAGGIGLFPVMAGTRVSMVVVALDPGVTIRVGDARLDRVGASALLGTAPNVHVHPSWQVFVPEGTVGDFNAAFRLTASANYADSDVITITLTNDLTTPTATPISSPTTTATHTPLPTATLEATTPVPPTATSTPTPTVSFTPTATATPSATISASPTETETATPTPIVTPLCAGDCDGNGEVTIDELIRGVNIALGVQTLAACPSFDRNSDEEVTIDELIFAVTGALEGCATPQDGPY